MARQVSSRSLAAEQQQQQRQQQQQQQQQQQHVLHIQPTQHAQLQSQPASAHAPTAAQPQSHSTIPATTHQIRHLTGPHSATSAARAEESTDASRKATLNPTAPVTRVLARQQLSSAIETAVHDAQQPVHDSQASEASRSDEVVQSEAEVENKENKHKKGNKRTKVNSTTISTGDEGEVKKEIDVVNPSPPPGFPYFGKEIALPTFIPAPFPFYAPSLQPEAEMGFEEAYYPQEWLDHEGVNWQ
jgi:hypothetical protein